MASKPRNRLARPSPLSRQSAAQMAPLGRVLDPEEVAGLAAYLASEDAKSVTGQAIVIDGGQVMP